MIYLPLLFGQTFFVSKPATRGRLLKKRARKAKCKNNFGALPFEQITVGLLKLAFRSSYSSFFERGTSLDIIIIKYYKNFIFQ
jgi:hypothetical protein